MSKRLILVICVIVVTVMCLGMVAYAEGTVPFTLYTYSATSTLTISGTKATCTSKVTGYSGETTKIVIGQTLQKKTSSGTWSEVTSWSETVANYKASVTNTRSGLSSGTYRLKTIFTVYAGSDYEVLTKYSTEKTV